MPSTPIAASTPSPPPHIHTPPTPRHGYADSWEPYSPPRKSARISSQKSNAARTPSPKNSSSSSHRSSLQIQHQRQPQLRSPRSTTRRDYSDNATSPAPSPRKKQMPPLDQDRRVSGHLTVEGAATAAASLGLHGGSSKKEAARTGRTHVSNQAAAMLPTPAKTPARKDASAQNEANIAAIARSLFHAEEEVMPDPKKKRAKKYSGFSMDSFTAMDAEEPIKIFTDSHERIPEVDGSADNPFFGQGVAVPAEPTKRRSKRKHVSIPGEGKETIEGATRREDGLVYVFRGKKIFKKFEDDEDTNSIGQDDGDQAQDSSAASKRLTRSSIKPRLLFPPDTMEEDELDEDEEADTEIEDGPADDKEVKEPETPLELVEDAPDTPKAPKFAPASPPTTARATRSGNKAADELTPMKPTRGGKRSPFDGWRQTKSGSGGGHKRPAEELASDVPAKRTRA